MIDLLIDFMLIYVDLCWILGFKLGAKRGGWRGVEGTFFALGAKMAPRAPKSPPRPLQAQNKRKVNLPFGRLLGGFWGHVGPKSHQKPSLNALKIFIDFDIDF